MPLNPKDAPPGFVAKQVKDKPFSCFGCYFLSHLGCFTAGPCQAGSRKDECDVIFVKRPKKGKDVAPPPKKGRKAKAISHT